jgi:hypothetical protein
MAAGEKLPLTERIFYAYSGVSRWLFKRSAESRAAGSRANRNSTPWGGAITLIRVVIVLGVVLLFPVFMLPMMLARFALVGRKGLRYGASVAIVSGDAARWGRGAMPADEPVTQIRAGLAAIATRDQGFRVRVLTDWAVGVTGLLCRSVVTGDAAWARTFMANGLYRAHQALLELRDRSDVTCEGFWQAVDATVVGASRSPLVEEVRVRVTCQGWRQERHQPTGVPLRGGPDPGTWSEDLTFARAADALTPPVGGLPASRCPSCGAALELDPGGACRYCQGIVTAGRHDWVLVSWQREPW